MKWTKFTLKTTTEAVDLISSMLDEIGIEGIEIEDNIPLSEADTKGMFIDILPELPPDDGTAKVSFYLEDLSNLETMPPSSSMPMSKGMSAAFCISATRFFVCSAVSRFSANKMIPPKW